jgi:hypothetical protein
MFLEIVGQARSVTAVQRDAERTLGIAGEVSHIVAVRNPDGPRSGSAMRVSSSW